MSLTPAPFDPSVLDYDPSDWKERLEGWSPAVEEYTWTSATTRIVGVIPYADSYHFLLWALGFSYLDTGGTLKRELPCMHPYWTNQYCMRVSLQPFVPNLQDQKALASLGPAGRKQFSHYAQYQKMQCTLDFAPPPPGTNFFSDAELDAFNPARTSEMTLKTRTSDTAGILTGDDIPWNVGDTVTVSWEDEGILARVDMEVTAANGTLTVSGGTGSVFPAADTAVTVNGNAVAGTGNAAPNSEANRFTFMDRQPIGETISIPTGSIVVKISADPAEDIPIVGETFIPVRMAAMTLRWYRVPLEYIRAPDGTYPLIEAAINCVNSKDFFGYPPGTLIVDQRGLKFTPIALPFTTSNIDNAVLPWMVDVEIPLVWKDPPNALAGSPVRGHNLRPAPWNSANVGKWYPSYYSGTERMIFEEYDFYDMFRGIRQMGLI